MKIAEKMFINASTYREEQEKEMRKEYQESGALESVLEKLEFQSSAGAFKVLIREPFLMRYVNFIRSDLEKEGFIVETTECSIFVSWEKI